MEYKKEKIPTIGNLLDFVLEHKTTKVFRNESTESIAARIVNGIKNNSLYFALSPDNKICGMLLAEIDHGKKIIFVTENLALALNTLKLFAKRAKEEFPEYEIQAMRHDMHRIFNTNKLYNKLK